MTAQNLDARLKSIETTQQLILTLLQEQLPPVRRGKSRVDPPASSFAALRAEIARQDVAREERALRRAQK